MEEVIERVRVRLSLFESVVGGKPEKEKEVMHEMQDLGTALAFAMELWDRDPFYDLAEAASILDEFKEWKDLEGDEDHAERQAFIEAADKWRRARIDRNLGRERCMNGKEAK